ncbi:MAG TPA: efflux RND transporter periplasmic adaptor subunit [Planctomycetia bacterium]|nr:efflux RND transporter periplasmic adaptor subunit [Planctomycetia bacterium]
MSTRPLRRLFDSIPTVLALALLGAVAYWGHSSGWKIGKFSTLTGQPPPPPDDWCPEHGVAETCCAECKPELFQRHKQHGWCAKHGVSECPRCHPELAELKAPPGTLPPEPAAALDLLPRGENNSRCKLHHRLLQMASAEAANKAGIDVDVVSLQPVTESIAAPGEIGYDQTRTARISSRAAGAVARLFKSIGDQVAAGEVVAAVDAAEVGRAKAELAAAVAQKQTRTRTWKSARESGGAIAERIERELEAGVEEARLRVVAAEQALANLGLPVPADLADGDAKTVVERLRFLGIPAAQAERFAAEGATGNLLPVRSPLAGTVVAAPVVAGEAVEAGKLLLSVADVGRLWLHLHVKQEDARHVAIGKRVEFRSDGDGQVLSGPIAWVGAEIDPRTRAIPVRVDVANSDGALKARAYGSGKVILRYESQAMTVPAESVQWDGCCHVVFVRDRNYLADGAPKIFHVRQVRPGTRDGKTVELLAGVLPGEVVASKGSHSLRGELLRANLGAG